MRAHFPTQRTGKRALAFVEQGFEVAIKPRDEWLDVSGSGMLRAETLREAGLDPNEVGGFAWGMGLERLAMLKFGIKDIRTLWQPPYVQTTSGRHREPASALPGGLSS